MGLTVGGIGWRPRGGGGDSSMKCPDVCVWGLKMYPLQRTPYVKKHTHIEGFLSTLNAHIMV